MGGFTAQKKGLWSLETEKMLQDRGALPEEEGDVVREYKAMHDEIFLSSWLRDVGEDKKEREMDADSETKELVSKKRTREEEKEENETEIVKIRCVNPVSTEAFDIFCQGEDSEGRRNGKSSSQKGGKSPNLGTLAKKDPVVASDDVSSNPFVSAETLKACALIGLHLLAAGDEAGSSGSQSPDLGDLRRQGCPKSPHREGDVESWTESEGTSSSDQCEHNVESLTLNATGQDQSGGMISLFSWRIGNLRGWLLAATSPWICCAKKCMRPGSWDAATKRPGVTARNALLSP